MLDDNTFHAHLCTDVRKECLAVCYRQTSITLRCWKSEKSSRISEQNANNSEARPKKGLP